MIITIFQYIALFLGIQFTFLNIRKIYLGENVSVMNIIIMSAAWTVFIFMSGMRT